MNDYERLCARWLLEELGVEVPWRPGPARRLTETDEQEILDGLEMGDSYRVIAARIGFSRDTVWRVAKAARERSRSVARGTSSNLTPTIQQATP